MFLQTLPRNNLLWPLRSQRWNQLALSPWILKMTRYVMKNNCFGISEMFVFIYSFCVYWFCSHLSYQQTRHVFIYFVLNDFFLISHNSCSCIYWCVFEFDQFVCWFVSVLCLTLSIAHSTTGPVDCIKITPYLFCLRHVVKL